MISVKTEGRLGNQLFQYAFIINCSKITGEAFLIDQSIDRFLVYKYFKIPYPGFYFFNRYIFSLEGFKNIFSIHIKKTFYSVVRKLYQQKELVFLNTEDPETEKKKIVKACIYKGFFQSEMYFIESAPIIRNSLIIRSEFVKQYQKASVNLPDLKIITVHIRRGDYLNSGFSLPVSYYRKALKFFNKNDWFCVFVSDDPEFVENEFIDIDNKYVSENSEIIDLQFLINADACILSNSSFSWWGAWLNSKANSTIIAPALWMGITIGEEYPCRVIPEGWTVIDVE